MSRKGPPRAFFGCVALIIGLVFVCGACGLSRSREFIRFNKHAHVDAGTALEPYVETVLADEFVHEATEDEGPDDAGVSTWVLLKRNGPPIGTWRLVVRHADGGIIDVTTVIPD